MINTYERYLKNAAGTAITTEECHRIYKAMAEGMEKCTLDDKMDFWFDTIKCAARYCKIRNDWETMSDREWIEADEGRTLAHDSFITSLNILSRIMDQEGLDSSWRSDLGEERKRIGDYACFISYITGISNR